VFSASNSYCRGEDAYSRNYCASFVLRMLSRWTAFCNSSEGWPTAVAIFSTSSLLGRSLPACNLLACSHEMPTYLLSSRMVMSSWSIAPASIVAKEHIARLAAYFQPLLQSRRPT
jgi:hypothetical protein